MGSKSHKNQEEAIMLKLPKNWEKFFYTNADSIISKRNEIQSLVWKNNADLICITEILPKSILLKIEASNIQRDGYNCFSNVSSFNC